LGFSLIVAVESGFLGSTALHCGLRLRGVLRGDCLIRSYTDTGIVTWNLYLVNS